MAGELCATVRQSYSASYCRVRVCAPYDRLLGGRREGGRAAVYRRKWRTKTRICFCRTALDDMTASSLLLLLLSASSIVVAGAADLSSPGDRLRLRRGIKSSSFLVIPSSERRRWVGGGGVSLGRRWVIIRLTPPGHIWRRSVKWLERCAPRAIEIPRLYGSDSGGKLCVDGSSSKITSTQWLGRPLIVAQQTR